MENVIERGAILARHGRLRIDLPDGKPASSGTGFAKSGASLPVLTDEARRERDRANIIAALEASGGKVFGQGGAAQLLDVKPTTLASRIKALGISVKREGVEV